MEIITDIRECNGTRCAATIGSFDGVHMGHRAMVAELREAAIAEGLPLTVVTFARHPRLLFDGECEPFLLTTNSEKAALFEEMGVDRMVLLDFDSCMAAMCAERFMREVLADAIGVRLLGVGYDHHFGKPCEGEGFEQYAAYGKELGIEVMRLSPYTMDGGKVSSTVVRRALNSGDIAASNAQLGHAYRFSGTVIKGAGIGRGLGFPTANIQPDEVMKLLPSNGVYEVDALLDGERIKGVMNIGTNPTVRDCMLRSIEVHLLDFSGDIYGTEITVEPVRRLRGEVKFGSIDALKLQIGVDVARVRRGI
ncbi:MAG: riboflavin biosynthesis protein RibF [Bacteroidaceae bacterium]|nr:riboflavin biosynthesis protein RibF [Bacteroidaceae bacterium]